MKVTLIAQTTMDLPDDTVPWEPETATQYAYGHGTDLIEFAGRSCYQSWSRPNPATVSNRDYLAHIIEVGHESVLEHAYATVYVEGVSRSLTHELIRHRHLNVSQLSQRFVDESKRDWEPVIPPIFQDEPEAAETINQAVTYALRGYDYLVAYAEAAGATRKQAREAARAVLPNCTETKIVVTGNMRTWRHVIKLRGSDHADAEIQEFAATMLTLLSENAGTRNAFLDMLP